MGRARNIRSAMLLAGIAALLSVGCQDLERFLTSPGMLKAEPQADPSVTWVPEPTEILDLKGPSQAVVGSAVVLTVQGVIGSSSCNRFGEVTLEVDDVARTVSVAATRLAKKADVPIACTDDYGWTSATASFTPQATGTYHVTAQNFKSGYGLPGEGPTSGMLDIEVGSGQ